jgi:hypothetical protein
MLRKSGGDSGFTRDIRELFRSRSLRKQRGDGLTAKNAVANASREKELEIMR